MGRAIHGWPGANTKWDVLMNSNGPCPNSHAMLDLGFMSLGPSMAHSRLGFWAQGTARPMGRVQPSTMGLNKKPIT